MSIHLRVLRAQTRTMQPLLLGLQIADLLLVELEGVLA
jgi:hypothetical protein